MSSKLSLSALCPLLFLLISCSSSSNNPTSTTIYQTVEPNRWTLVGSFGSVRAIASNGSVLVVGTDYAGAHRSSDDGMKWDSIEGLPGRLSALVSMDGDFFAVAGPDGVHRSSNGGVNWALSSSGMGSSPGVAALAANGSALFAGTFDGRVFRTSDKGSSWTLVNETGLPDSTRTIRAIACVGDDMVVLCGNGGTFGIYQYSHSSGTWASVPGAWVNSVQFLYANGSRMYAGTSAGLYCSIDMGQTWTITKLSLPSVYAFAANPDYSAMFAAFSSRGVLRSDDDGATWVVTGLIGDVLALHKNYLFCGDGPAVWRLKID